MSEYNTLLGRSSASAKVKRCLGQVRWASEWGMAHQKLQQLWEVVTYEKGVAVERVEEWRDVPDT